MIGMHHEVETTLDVSIGEIAGGDITARKNSSQAHEFSGDIHFLFDRRAQNRIGQISVTSLS